MSRLEADVAAWDGKSADAIAGVYARHAGRRGFLDGLVALLEKEPLQRGATWLLKHHLEQADEPGDRKLADRVYAVLPDLTHWESRLHVLQCVPRLPISRARRKRVEAFVREALEDQKKFVRAWAYGALYELARQHDEYRAEALERLDRALESEAASVKARIRQLQKRGF